MGSMPSSRPPVNVPVGAPPAPARFTRSPTARLPTRFGEFNATAFGFADGQEHMAVWMGDIEGERVLARVHSSCLTGDVFASARCDCGAQLDEALRRIAQEGRGIIVYLQQEGRGIGLVNKLHAYTLQEEGANTVEANEKLGFPADAREYGAAATILRALGVRSVNLLTNNPRKLAALERENVRVEARVALDVGATDWNRSYLHAKKHLMGHLL